MKKSIEFNGRRFSCEYGQLNVSPDPVNFMYVTRVTTGSPAKKLGVKPGDMLLTINANHSVETQIKDLYSGTASSGDNSDDGITYLFYRQNEGKSLFIQGPAIPLGVELEDTSERIIQLCESFSQQDEQLQQLWQRGDWAGLLKASEYASFRHSWLTRLILFISRKKYRGAGILMEGIARYELGEKDQGMQRIKHYLDDCLNANTTEFHALCFYYMGLLALENDDKDKAHEFLYSSEMHCRCVVLQQRLQQLGVECSNKNHMQYQRFPVDFQLENLEQTAHFQLGEMLAQLGEQQFLFIAGLPWYRTNTPLNRYMLEYEKIVKHFPAYCGAFVVLTDVNDKSDHHKSEFEVEERLIAEGLPVHFLYDENGLVTQKLQQPSSPNIYVLNKQGVIINQAGISFHADEIWGWFAYEFGDIFAECDG